MAKLVVLEGGEVGGTYDVAPAPLHRIGSGGGSSVMLAGTAIADPQAELRSDGATFTIDNLVGSPEMLVNGLPVSSSPLSHGDVIQWGGLMLLFDSQADAAASAAPVGSDPEMTQAPFMFPSVDEPDIDPDASGMVPTIASRQALYDNPDALVASLQGSREPAQMLASFLKVTHALVGTLDLNQLLGRILEILFDVIPADRGTVLLRNRADGVLRPVTAKRRDNRPIRGKVASRTIVKEVLATRQGLLTRDAMEDDRFNLGASIVEQKIRSALCVPLARPGDPEVLGLIYLDSSASSRGFGSDHLRLLVGIASEAVLAIENARLVGEVSEMKRIEHELDIAANIQMDLVPSSAPEIEGLEVAGMMVPAKEVGGDYYDFVKSADGRELFVVIGDVSGKGVPACLVMVMARSFFRPLLQFATSTKMIIEELNKLLYRDTRKSMFMTMLLLEWDIGEQTLSWSGAGHEHLLVYRAATGEVERILAGGVPLGMRPDSSEHFEQHDLVLSSGDTVLLYTDGVTEAINSEGEMFELDRTEALLREYGEMDAEDIVMHAMDGLGAFAGDTEQHDDVTMVVLKKT